MGFLIESHVPIPKQLISNMIVMTTMKDFFIVSYELNNSRRVITK